jgi:Protein of unknown function (DUF4233)
MLCASVLIFEAIVVGLAIPVALALTDADPALVGWGFGGLALCCLVCAGVVGRRWGIAVGWVLQVLILLTGLVVAAMVVLGVMFGALWFAAVHYGGRVDALKAAQEAT